MVEDSKARTTPTNQEQNTEWAWYPLTLCDNMSEGGNMGKAWIVEGILDAGKVRSALDRVVKKWPALGGRVEVTGKKRYQIRVPLGDLPAGYEPYGFSVTESPLPLSHYVQLPLPAITEYPPVHLFTPAERLKITGFEGYAKHRAPLTHWHITHFKHPGEEYSIINIHYSHGVHDGVGFALLIHAVVAELAGKEWDAPPLPTPGLNENRYKTLVEEEVRKVGESQKVLEPLYNFSAVGLWGILVFVFGSLWDRWVNGYGEWNLVIPYNVHMKLAEETRREAEEAGWTDVRPTSGDILFAWLVQSIYKDGTKPNRTIGLNSMVSLRSEWNGELALYPHNCLGGLRYPTFTVHEVTIRPLHELSVSLAKAKTKGSKAEEGALFYKRLAEADAAWPTGGLLPIDSRTDETVTMSNVSMARVAALDWSAAGGGATLTHYKLFPNAIKVANIVNINGRLENGDLVVNLLLNRRRMESLEREYRRLEERFR
ncbi:hypothetical protein CC2G_013710 [Coprinopsis cinerea AmutBmut pab1-1]|nr:hypothetical protein CC2G_013710 [Coprinopsis cinerea AmutBmut pab1-1]